MNISKTDAQILTNDYINFGNASHFDFGGNPIDGFLFTRRELYGLFQANPQSGLFLMFALSPEIANLEYKHFNLVIGGFEEGSNRIADNHLIISSRLPYTGGLTFTDNDIKGGPVLIITIDQLIEMKSNFQLSQENHNVLTSSSGTKIRGIRLYYEDVQDIGLHANLCPENENDEFIFMPVLRSLGLVEPFDRPYVSIATARFDRTNSTVVGTIIEYCLPCPSACPNNFPIQ